MNNCKFVYFIFVYIGFTFTDPWHDLCNGIMLCYSGCTGINGKWWKLFSPTFYPGYGTIYHLIFLSLILVKACSKLSYLKKKKYFGHVYNLDLFLY